MRKRLYEILELAEDQDSASRAFDIFIISLNTKPYFLF